MTKHELSRLGSGLLTAVLALGCDVPESDAISMTTQALGVSGTPQGLTCGVSYQRPKFTGSPLIMSMESGRCLGVSTLSTNSPSLAPFSKVSDGDRGLPSGSGFWHQVAAQTGGASLANSDQLRLPRGTACGFKEACNNSGQTCMGMDANIACPRGWTRKAAADLNAPGGCNFVWCEYNDPFNLCNDWDGQCQFAEQPHGLACGITDSDTHNGRCMGLDPVTQGCPAGYQRTVSFYDWGRASGHGVGWCSRADTMVVFPF